MPKSKQAHLKLKRSSKKSSTTSPETRDHSPLPRDLLRHLYAEMLRCRIALHRLRTSKSATDFHPSTGREAIEVGCSIELRPDDILLCPYNSLVAPLVSGIPLPSVLVQAGSPIALDAPPASAATALFMSRGADALAVAAGVAYSFKLQKKPNVVFALDAGTTPARGVDILALLARDRLPVIAVIENRGGHPERLLASARDHKIPIISVDANDVVAVYRVAREALHRARANRGATLIDCYPLPLPGGRSTDPISAMQQYMLRFNCWSPEWQSELEQKFSAEFRSAIPS
jgi:pyruvate dehydrogenase E1 component alpha subunit